MLKTRVSTPRLQLHYHEAPELEAHHICFPSTEGLLDRKQVGLQQVLTPVERQRVRPTNPLEDLLV